ncbi:MAG: GntR family transcriptional regulator [Verrucomicrobiaceae bacterium]|nr:MAG: GntR family transcriptional regulator [Verrucomicrobiaceae bacterium]
MPKHPLHRRISDQIREGILSGKFGKAQRLPSEAQLVEEFGTSRPTVARAMRDLQAEGLIERRAGSGSYVREVTASVPTKQLGLLVPGLGTTEIFGVICGEIASLARVNGYSVIWGGSALSHSDLSRDHAEQLCEQFIQRQVEGVFFAPFELSSDNETVNERIATRLRDAGIHVVLLDRDLRAFPSRSDFDLVGVDNLAGGYLLAEHLVRLGCRRIAFVARPHSASSVDIRIAGVREALLRHKIELRPDWVSWGDPADLKFVRKLTAGRLFDAFICANDHTAAVLMRTLEQLKLSVPGQVRVAGFDDVRYATLLVVPLTTIHQPCREIGVTAFHTLMQRIAQPEWPPRAVMLTPHLAVRGSCGAYQANRNASVRVKA